MKCAECGNELRETTDAIVEQYKGEDFEVHGIRHFQCDACGDYELPLEEADRLSLELASQYAARHDLLTPSEIKAVRKGLGMRQSDFEDLLGVSSPTCSRWENGSVQQSRPADKLMRAVRDVPGMADYLRGRIGASFAEVVPFTSHKAPEKRTTLSFEEVKEG